MDRKWLLPAVLAAVLVLAPACGGSDEPETQPSQEAKEVTEAGDPVPAGLYTFGEFEIPVTFELSEGWSVGDTFAEFFYVHQESELFFALAHPDYVLDSRGEEVAAPDLTPQEAIDLLAERAPKGRVAESQEAAGQEAPTAEFELTEPFTLFGGGLGEFNNPLARHFRVSALRSGDELVLVMQIASTPEGWAETAPLAASLKL